MNIPLILFITWAIGAFITAGIIISIEADDYIFLALIWFFMPFVIIGYWIGKRLKLIHEQYELSK
jgi:hypothetical protein